MTHSEISNIITRHGAYLALSLAIVELAHRDIARFNTLHQKYTALPGTLTTGQRNRLQQAAVHSAAGRRFLESGFLTMWAMGQ